VSAGRVLVTGAAGFVGRWMLEALRARGERVVATYRPDAPPARFVGAWERVDLRDPAAVDRLIAQVRPRALFHLAAVAAPREASRYPEEALRTNYGAVDHLLRACARHAPGARLLLVSSGEVYGRRAAHEPAAREGDALHPESLYAATKVAAERRALLAFERDGLDVVRARPFNHTGPGRPPDYAEAWFARQLAEIEAGQREPVVRVGNLDAIRDFSDVRDVVAAYLLVLERGEPGAVYNVCSGRGRTLRSLLEMMRVQVRIPVRIQVDPARYEPIAASGLALVGDPSRLSGLGWQPRFELDRTLRDLLRAAGPGRAALAP
jgi:GDP-4-dehydro-6-deoxy-D-mannose reductase